MNPIGTAALEASSLAAKDPLLLNPGFVRAEFPGNPAATPAPVAAIVLVPLVASELTVTVPP